MTIDELLERYVDRTGGCWLWTGAICHGYGYVRFDGRMRRAHRVVYIALVAPIAQGMTLDHTCAMRACVNPLHLEPVTIEENIRRATERYRARTHCIHGHEFTPENIGRGARGERVCRECRRRWNADAKRKLRQAS